MSAVQQARGRGGVFYGWYMMPGLMVLIWVGYWMYLGVLGPYVGPLMKEFGWSRAEIAGAYSVGSIVGGFGFPLWGYLIDRFGPRKMIYVGIICTALGHLIWAVTSQLWMYYLGWIILIPSTSWVTYPVAIKIIGNWFIKRRGFNTALLTVMGALVYMGTALIGWLIVSFGWRMTAVIMAVVCIVVLYPIAIFLVRDTPQEKGLLPDNALPSANLGQGSQEQRPTPNPAAPAIPSFTVGAAVRTIAVWLIGLAMMASSLALVTQTTFQVPFLEEMGVDKVLAGAVLGFMGLISLIGRFAAGPLLDRLGRDSSRFIFAAGMLLMAIGLVILTQAADMGLVWVFLFIFGIGQGLYVPCSMAMILLYFGAPSYGTIYGVTMFVSRIGTIVAPVLMGWARDVTGSYVPAFWIGVAVLVVFGLLLLIARAPAIRAAAPSPSA